MSLQTTSCTNVVTMVKQIAGNFILSLFIFFSCMYNLFRCKNEDGSSQRKKNALRRLKSSLNNTEMTKRFSGHLQNVSNC